MDRALLYHVSICIVGATLGAFGLSAILDGGMSAIPLLLAISGFGMVLSVLYERLSGNVSEAASNPRAVRLTAFGALLAVLAGVLQVL